MCISEFCKNCHGNTKEILKFGALLDLFSGTCRINLLSVDGYGMIRPVCGQRLPHTNFIHRRKSVLE